MSANDLTGWLHSYCQMTNHYHLLVEIIDGNLSRGMRQLNGIYTQMFNRRYGAYTMAEIGLYFKVHYMTVS